MSHTKHQLMFALVGANRSAPAQRSNGTNVCIVEDADAIDRLTAAGIIGTATTTFAPKARDGRLDDDIVGFEGELRGSGDELRLGESFTLQVVKYSVAGFLSLGGPTLIRIEDDEDFELFIEDADRARQEGQFSGFLVGSSVQLADEVSLGGDHARGGPRDRLFVDRSGYCRTTPTGVVLGQVADGLEFLDSEWRERVARSTMPCPVALGQVVDEGRRVAELSARPWLGVYLDALAAQRDAAVRAVGATNVSGFGATLSGLPSGESVTSPVIAYQGNEAFVYQLRTGTVLKTSTATARIVDAISRSDGASQHVVPPAVRERAERELARRGIQIERREMAS